MCSCIYQQQKNTNTTTKSTWFYPSQRRDVDNKDLCHFFLSTPLEQIRNVLEVKSLEIHLKTNKCGIQPCKRNPCSDDLQVYEIQETKISTYPWSDLFDHK